MTGFAACFLFSCFSLYTLKLELSPFRLATASKPSFFTDFPSSLGDTGLSTYSNYLVMRECYEGTQRAWFEGQFGADTFRFLEACHQAASNTVHWAPTFSFGWLTKAYLEISRLDEKGFNASLSMSYGMAPHALWLVEARVRLSELYYLLLSHDNLIYHDEDLKILTQSWNGSKVLAELYQKDEYFRQRVVAIVETLPPNDQKRFLSSVRRLSNIP